MEMLKDLKIVAVGFPKDREYWIAHNQNVVGKVTRVLTDVQESINTARLFASANLLYESLEEMLGLDDWETEDIAPKEMIEKAKAAIQAVKSMEIKTEA